MWNARATLPVVVGLACLMPGAGVAQEPVPVAVGTRVRLTFASSNQRVRGTVLSLDGDSIGVQAASPGTGTASRFALQGVKRMEVSVGRHHPVGKSILLGTGIGAATGVLIGLVVPLCEPSGGWFDCFLEPTTRSEAVETGAVLSGFGGLVIGAIVGAIGHEKWAPGTLPGWRPIIAARRSGFALGITVPLHRPSAGRR
jgi:hypothetical protein